LARRETANSEGIERRNVAQDANYRRCQQPTCCGYNNPQEGLPKASIGRAGARVSQSPCRQLQFGLKPPR
jgi:hypothetical protein